VKYPGTTHEYDWVDPLNQYISRGPDFIPIAPEIVLPAFVPPRAPAPAPFVYGGP
jgi:hypothetical protein